MERNLHFSFGTLKTLTVSATLSNKFYLPLSLGVFYFRGDQRCHKICISLKYRKKSSTCIHLPKEVISIDIDSWMEVIVSACVKMYSCNSRLQPLDLTNQNMRYTYRRYNLFSRSHHFWFIEQEVNNKVKSLSHSCNQKIKLKISILE